MLKRDITYEDFDGNQATDTFYFNLTKTEIINFQVKYEEGLVGFLQKVIRTENQKELVALVQDFVLTAYGIRSDDGKRFIKNPQVREEFTQTLAYDALFVELATDEDAFDKFMKGVIPKDMALEIEKVQGAASLPQPPLPPTPSI